MPTSRRTRKRSTRAEEAAEQAAAEAAAAAAPDVDVTVEAKRYVTCAVFVSLLNYDVDAISDLGCIALFIPPEC